MLCSFSSLVMRNRHRFAMYFHAPCGVVLYCFVCKFYANKEKKISFSLQTRDRTLHTITARGPEDTSSSKAPATQKKPVTQRRTDSPQNQGRIEHKIIYINFNLLTQITLSYTDYHYLHIFSASYPPFLPLLLYAFVDVKSLVYTYTHLDGGTK